LLTRLVPMLFSMCEGGVDEKGLLNHTYQFLGIET
jgi:hypothetical protein